MLRKLLKILLTLIVLWALFGLAIVLTRALILIAFWAIVMVVFSILLLAVYILTNIFSSGLTY